MYVWCTRSGTSGARLRLGSSLPLNLFVCLILFNSFSALSQGCQGREEELCKMWDLLWVSPRHRQDGVAGLLGFPRQVKAALRFSGCNTRQRLPVCKLSRGKCSHICLPLLLPCCLSRNQKFQLEQSGDQPGDGDSSWRRTMKVQGRFLMVGPRSSFPLAGLLDSPHAA